MDSSNNVYIADAESSSIRVLNLDKGHVKNVVGGDIEPDNLFAYGDCDGIGIEAKLQHPLDVSFVNTENGTLLLVDTYNSAVKKVDLKTKRCQKFVNTASDLDLNEPSGICVYETTLWIADTNNHVIKFVDKFDINSEDFSLKEFSINFKDCVDSIGDLKFVHLNLGKGKKKLLVKFDFELNEQAENTCKVSLVSTNKLKTECAVCLRRNNKKENVFILDKIFVDIDTVLEVTLHFHLVLCVEDKFGSKMCKMVRILKSYSKSDLLKLSQIDTDFFLISISQ